MFATLAKAGSEREYPSARFAGLVGSESQREEALEAASLGRDRADRSLLKSRFRNRGAEDFEEHWRSAWHCKRDFEPVAASSPRRGDEAMDRIDMSEPLAQSL